MLDLFKSSNKKPMSNSRTLLRALKARADAKRTIPEIAADIMTRAFGSITFLTLNAIWFLVWIFINTGFVPGVTPFDPFPFGLLTTFVSLEAIILAIIVLISQNRAGKVADLREETDLHIDIISEQEITKILELMVLLVKKHEINLDKDKKLKHMLKGINMEKIETVLETQV